jgi:hypothetical protein
VSPRFDGVATLFRLYWLVIAAPPSPQALAAVDARRAGHAATPQS